MSNVHSVHAIGELPFDGGACNAAISDDQQLKELTNFLIMAIGQMSFPSFGLNIHFGRHRYVPNDNGGKTCMYEFEISGQEALPSRWIEKLRAALERIGSVQSFDYYDAEN